MLKNIVNHYKFPVLFFIWGVHGIIALWQYSSSGIINLQIGSISNIYLVILFVLTVWSLFFILLSFLSIKRQDRNQLWGNLLLRSKAGDWFLLISICGLLCLIFIWVIFGFSSATPESLIDNYLRIFTPVLILLTGILFEAILFVMINDDVEINKIDSQFAKKIIIVLSFLSALWLIISSTEMGIMPSYKGDWSRGLPAVPLFEWHILVAAFFLVFTTLLELNEKIAGFKYLDIFNTIAN